MMRKTWSINNFHWESLPEEVLNGRWNRVSYVSSSSPLVTNNGGIYMYCVSIPRANNKYLERIRTPIYMGISKNLRRRFKDHLEKKEIREMAACFESKITFHYLKIDPYIEKDVKVKFEQPMIDCFGKVVNKIDSVRQEASDIEVKVGNFDPI